MSTNGCPVGTESGWINGELEPMAYFTATYKWDIPWGSNPLVLTFYQHFQRDIQVCLGWFRVNLENTTMNHFWKDFDNP